MNRVREQLGDLGRAACFGVYAEVDNRGGKTPADRSAIGDWDTCGRTAA